MTRRLGTFSYLLPMTDEQLRAQVANVVDRGLVPWVEYAKDPAPGDHLWNLWRLPMTDLPGLDQVLAEIDACAEANPAANVRLVGYDPTRQNQAVAFVARLPRAGG
jgi:ribulose-bisphosphate carboxylase small chain